MANANVNFGFVPWNKLKRARMYPVQTAPTINICLNDLVAADTAGFVSAKLGISILVQDGAIIPANPGDNYAVLGSVLGCFDENMNPIQYIVAGRVGDGTTAGYVLVADHEDQEFMANVDAALTAADIDLNYDIYSGTLAAPVSTSTGISGQAIHVTGAATTNTLPIRLYRQAYPGIDVYSAAGCRMICKIQPECHYYGQSTAL